jgi:hypothetical protein
MALALISTHHITATGFAIHFENQHCNIMSPTPDRKLIASIPQINGLYTITTPVQEHTNITKLTVCELHHVLGHVSPGAVLHAVKEGLIEGVALDAASKPEFCDTCMKAKSTHIPFPKETQNQAHIYGDLIHTDLWGPAQMESITGHIYYMSFTDNFSCETKLDVMFYNWLTLETAFTG